jgi:DNA (cytosine-5)-methyltransferase 1
VTVYYNENDKHAAAWLRELIKQGLIADGVVDDRSIVEIDPRELDGYRQCHFFAGIGGWSLALRLAVVADDFPVWTGSCPCQPFSAAGKRRGTADERHLWPEFHRLIAECRPATVFGEQVASRDGRGWLAGVRVDLEAVGYAVGAADLCAASLGAPHIRQRLYWMADADFSGEHQRPSGGKQPLCDEMLNGGGMGNTIDPRLEERAGERRDACGLGDAASEQGGRAGQPWRDGVWLPCLDGKARRIEPGTFPLAHGVPARVGRLRGYGNAIVPQVAATFIRCCLA